MINFRILLIHLKRKNDPEAEKCGIQVNDETGVSIAFKYLILTRNLPMGEEISPDSDYIEMNLNILELIDHNKDNLENKKISPQLLTSNIISNLENIVSGIIYREQNQKDEERQKILMSKKEEVASAYSKSYEEYYKNNTKAA